LLFKEPIRFVYEGPLPYTRSGGGLPLKPTMNHLRVPGRPPPNVPQTIIEEDPVLITPPTTPPSPGAGLEPPLPTSGMGPPSPRTSSGTKVTMEMPAVALIMG